MNSSTPTVQSKISESDLEMLILKNILETDQDGHLTGIRLKGEAISSLARDLEARGFHQTARTVWNRHHKTALSRGKVKIVFPGEKSPGRSLADRIQSLKELHQLVELEVAPSGGIDSPDHYRVSSILGKTAAALFARLLDERIDYMTFALGGGQTMHELVSNLPVLRAPFTITATNFATRSPIDKTYDSSYLAMQVHSRATSCRANICSLPPIPDDDSKHAVRMHQSIFSTNGSVRRIFQESKAPDVTFVGVGDFNHTSLVIERVYKHLGFDAQSLAEFGPVGDLNLCIFDREGNDLTSAIAKSRLSIRQGTLFPQEPHCHPFLVGLNLRCFQELTSAGKKVIVVAGGAEKAKAIHALLSSRSRCINGLVTDETTLDKLLELSESASRKSD